FIRPNYREMLSSLQRHRSPSLLPRITARNIFLDSFPGLTPQALRCRLLRRLNDWAARLLRSGPRGGDELIELAGWSESAESLLDNIFLLTDHEGKQVVLFRFGNFVLIQGGDQMFRGGVPIILRDFQPRVSRLHFAAGVDARPTGGGAELIQDVLAQALLGVDAEAAEKPFEARVGCQSRNELVNHCGNRIVSAEPLVKRLLILGCAGHRSIHLRWRRLTDGHYR